MTKCVLLVVLPCMTVGMVVPTDSNKKLGRALATSVSESLQAMKALENQGLGDDASFRQGMLETLMSKQEVLTNPEVNRVIERANSLAEHQTIPEDAVCLRDWSRPCPDGWEDAGAIGCVAPASYKGGCKGIQHFDAARDRRRKFDFASACSAPWACAGNDECPLGRDYESCPLGWVSVGRGFCSQTAGS